MLAGHLQGELESYGMTCGLLWSICGELELVMKGRGALEDAESILGKSCSTESMVASVSTSICAPVSATA